jgi:hypothetical protein
MAMHVDTAPQVPSDLRSRLLRWLLHDLPYIVLLLASLLGVAWTNLSGLPASGYWVFMTPVAAGICIFAGWRQCHTREGRIRLAATQGLQWLGFLVAMYLIVKTDVHDVLNDDSIGLTLLTMVALAVFVSGLHVGAWRLCVIGGFLAATVPVVAWLEEAALFLLVGAVGLVALSFLTWWVRNKV